MKRFLRVFKNTTVRIFSSLLLILFLVSLFVFKDFYKAQWHKTLSFYYVYVGDNAYKKHKPQKAIDNYIKALELYPKHYRAQYNLGNLYVVYEDFYSALDAYSKALQLRPDFTVARINYAKPAHTKIAMKIKFMICRFIQKQVQKNGVAGLDYEYWQTNGWLARKRPWKH